MWTEAFLHKVVSNIFDNIVQYTADNTRVYIEMYVQSNKVIYVVKNTVREDALAEAEAIVKGGIGTFAGQGLLEAKQLVESQKGKFIISMDKVCLRQVCYWISTEEIRINSGVCLMNDKSLCVNLNLFMRRLFKS